MKADLDDRPEQEKTCTYTPAEAPSICSAGSRICSVNDKVLECIGGSHWEVLETCEHGCMEGECSPALAGNESTTGTESEGEAGTGLAGYLVSNPITIFFGLVVVIIIILVGVIYWKARPGSSAAPAPGPESA